MTMKEPMYNVPENKRIRVIIDTDADAEADDHFAIVHALLTPKIDVVGIVATHFCVAGSMERSFREIQNILCLLGLENRIPIYRGATEELLNEWSPVDSEGAQFIIEEALRSDDRPLFVLNIGAITNLASARLLAPNIDKTVLAVWIGGGPYPTGCIDFNLGNDIHAANVVVSSEMELWQIPLTAYTMMEVSFSELFERVRPCGKIGRYLYDNLMRVNDIECAMDLSFLPFAKNASAAAKTMIIRSGEGWSLGDNPAVGVLITPQRTHSEMRRAQLFNMDGSYGAYVSDHRMIRVHHSIDSRIILEDMFAKIRYHFTDDHS
jgi:purine nucleosidase